MYNKNYLCYQAVVTKKEKNGNDTIITIGTIARNVSAKSETEAIQKFIKYTQIVKTIERLEVDCFLIDTLIKID